MSLGDTLPTRDEIFAAAIAYFQVAHRDPITGASPPLGPRSFLGQEARALANLLSDVLGSVKSSDDDAIPGTYIDSLGVTRTRNSSINLDNWAYTLGLPSSVAGKFGRKSAQAGSGGVCAGVYGASGTVGVMVSTGDQLTDPSGLVIVKIRSGVTIPMAGYITITIDAETTGLKGNLPVGTVLRWSSAPPGLAATVTLTTAISGGYDIEDDVTLAMRIITKLQSPLRGGTAADYRFWYENSFDSAGLPIAISRSYPFPGRNGTGTIDNVITQAGSGSSRDPGATVATAAHTYVETVRPVGDGGQRAVRPYFDPAQTLAIRVRVLPATGYAFDWDDSQGQSPATTSTTSPFPGSAIHLNTTTAPANLEAAFVAGNQPRIAITWGDNPLPFIARVTARANNTPSGKCTLTLDTALPYALSTAESVYAAGPAVMPVALAVLNYVDNVGPSRSSGYAPSTDIWEDYVSVARIAKAAILAVDAAGQQVCVTSPNVGDIAGTTKPGVLIKVGSGSETAADFVLYDNDLSQGPQLPEVVKIFVHKGGV